jgi:hypothetical protein
MVNVGSLRKLGDWFCLLANGYMPLLCKMAFPWHNFKKYADHKMTTFRVKNFKEKSSYFTTCTDKIVQHKHNCHPSIPLMTCLGPQNAFMVKLAPVNCPFFFLHCHAFSPGARTSGRWSHQHK